MLSWGDEVVVISQASDGSVANDLYEVKALIDMGDEASNRTAFFIHIQDAQELFILGERVHEVAVTVDDLDRVRKSNQTLENKLEGTGLDSSPRQEFARTFYVAMKADMQGMWILYDHYSGGGYRGSEHSFDVSAGKTQGVWIA
jgi:putative ABC transport system permease protein